MSIILTCNVTGKTVKWSNQSIIDAKIKQYGSEEAFRVAYVYKGANKKAKVKSTLLRDGEVDLMKSICEEGVKLAPSGLSTKHLTAEQYAAHYQKKVDALVAAGASSAEINWMKQRLDRWRNGA
jgi:hypothetical protein